MLVELGIDVGVDDFGQRRDQPLALVGGGQLDQIGDVGRMERLDHRARGFVVARLDRIEHARDEVRPQPVILVEHLGALHVGRGGSWMPGSRVGAAMSSLSLICHSLPKRVAPSYGRTASGASRAGRLKAAAHPFFGDVSWPTPTP